jgi:ABC-type anion transport system duplicated permease subunit
MVVWVFAASLQIEVTAVFAIFASSLWNRNVSDGLHSSDRAHLEDLKNLVEVRPPGGDPLFITLRV